MTRIDPCHRLARALLATAALLASAAAWSAKTDIVQLRNGDRLTGEVKQLSYGKLKYDTDNMGTLYIEWDKIVMLKSDRVLQCLELFDGSRLTGKALEPEAREAGVLYLQTGSGVDQQPLPREVQMDQVARIETIYGGSWRERMDGSASIGYSFAQSTGVEVMNLNVSLYSRDRERAWSIDADSQITDDEESPSSKRGSLLGKIERPRREGYFYGSNVEFSTNEELGLDMRSLLGFSLGRYLERTGKQQWRVGVGLAGSAEDYGPDENVASELQIASEIRRYYFDTPQRNLDLDVAVLPSLSDWGRLRVEVSLDLRYEIVKDFFFEISLYESHDNRPAEDAPNNDWSVTTSLGYKF